MKLLLAALILVHVAKAQDIPKGTNEIEVKGVTFQQVVNNLLDSGYTIEKLDSNYKTVRTEFHDVMGKKYRLMVHLSIGVRVKDSTAFITGRWYNDLSVSGTGSNRGPAPNDIYTVEYTWGAEKPLFAQMDRYARSLKGELTYVKH